MALLLCGFAGFFGVQIVKVFSPVRLEERPKLFLAAVASLGAAAGLFTHRPADLVIYGIAGAGFSILIHKAVRFLSLAGDWCVSDVLAKRRTPR